MDYTVTTTVFTTLEVIGFHRWPSAPAGYEYLRSQHRHKFGIAVELSVYENDREVEFHDLRRKVEVDVLYGMADTGVIDGTSEINFGEMSCEAIATHILDWLRSEYPGRAYYRVDVNEDGENGASVEAARA